MSIALKSLFALILAASCSSASAQVGRGGAYGGGRAGVAGGRYGFGGGGSLGTRGLDARAVNPNFNPQGSLTPFQNFHPAGSLSPALNLNPEGSLFRPRTSDQAYRVGRPAVRSNSRRTAYRPLLPPSDTQLRIMPRDSLAAWVRVGSAQLASSLAEYSNGDKWRSYLELDRVNETLSLDNEDNDAQLDEARQQDLNAILQKFDRIAAEEQFRRVTRLPGFTATRSSLQELLQASAGDARQRLARSAEALNQALAPIAKDSDWQQYLTLPQLEIADALDQASSAEPDLADFRTSLARFEVVRSDPKYAVISRLPEFQATQANLASYIRSTTKPAEPQNVTDDD